MGAFELALPAPQTTSVIFSSPHSGRAYTTGFMEQSVLDELSIRSSEDAFVDQLFGTAPQSGAPLISAVMPRAFLDLNRSYDELDPALIDGVTSRCHNPRIASGLGVIPRVVSNGRNIYRQKLSLHDANRRINRYWHPYHDQLCAMMHQTRAAFGKAILIDCHSMPSEAIQSAQRPGRFKPDVVIGDRFGAAACTQIVAEIECIFLQAGLKVSRNSPFAGAFIAQHYGRPTQGFHVIQIEINRDLYMNERLIRPNEKFVKFKSLIEEIIKKIATLGTHDISLAAE